MVRGMGEDGEQYVGGVRASLDGLFFYPIILFLYSQNFYPLFLSYYIPNILFTMSIIPSLNTLLYR